MATITAAQVKELRDETGLGMMECKKALVETDGDKDLAVKNLRERGMAIAGKKAGRAASEGVIAAEVYDSGKSAVMVEVNCETDFVARNEIFQAFVQEIVDAAKTAESDLAGVVKDQVMAKISEIGENILIGRNEKFTAQGAGIIASYIHLGGKVGVLVEIGCENDATAGNDVFKETAKDVTLHIAACNPRFLGRDDVAEDVIKEEREIYVKQAEGKPENIIEKIVKGKIDKFYSQVCLVEQGFVKDPDQTVAQLLEAKGKELGDTLSIRRFTRMQIGG